MIFDKRQTNIAKGVSVLLLLWHHLFYNNQDNYQLFHSVFIFKGIPVECFLADFCKVCVAVFLILSGYGLCKSWERDSSSMILKKNYKARVKADIIFVKNHLLKLMFSFWFVFIIFVPLSIWLGTPFYETYQGNIVYGIIDFCGLSSLFGTPSVNATWWFMSPIIIYYLIFPILTKILEYCGELLLALSAFILFVPVFYRIPGEVSIWLLPFTVGMYCSRIELFERLDIRINTYPKKSIFVGCAIISTALIRYSNTDMDTLFAIVIILCTYFLLSRVPVLNVILERLGKHSGTVFMFHTFIFYLYFKDFIYGFKYSLIIFLILTVICYCVAVGLEYLKKLFRYDRLVHKLTS